MSGASFFGAWLALGAVLLLALVAGVARPHRSRRTERFATQDAGDRDIYRNMPFVERDGDDNLTVALDGHDNLRVGDEAGVLFPNGDAQYETAHIPGAPHRLRLVDKAGGRALAMRPAMRNDVFSRGDELHVAARERVQIAAADPHADEKTQDAAKARFTLDAYNGRVCLDDVCVDESMLKKLKAMVRGHVPNIRARKSGTFQDLNAPYLRADDRFTTRGALDVDGRSLRSGRNGVLEVDGRSAIGCSSVLLKDRDQVCLDGGSSCVGEREMGTISGDRTFRLGSASIGGELGLGTPFRVRKYRANHYLDMWVTPMQRVQNGQGYPLRFKNKV